MSYCHSCGSENQLVQSDYEPRFDVETGKPVMIPVCTNSRCKYRCYRVGHDFIGRGLLHARRCGACGEPEICDFL